MHILATTTATLDEAVEPIDLNQTPGDMVVLSFSDSDLSGLAAAWSEEAGTLPSLRMANLRDLRHPMSTDLWIDRVGAKAKIVVVRLLGGRDWWGYGVDRLTSMARERSMVLALLPGRIATIRGWSRRPPSRLTSTPGSCGTFVPVGVTI